MTEELKIQYDWVSPRDLEEVYKIEVEGYPSDEAASLDALKYRLLNASSLFLGAYIDTSVPPDRSRDLIGFVNGTLSTSTTLTHQSMGEHVPDGRSVCVHSVCVAGKYRRRGVGARLLKEYVARLEKRKGEENEAEYDRILLITHAPLRAFYESAGFGWVGPSAVVHGAEPWFEMRLDLPRPSPPDSLLSAPQTELEQSIANQTLPPGIWDALQRGSRTRVRPTGRVLDAFEGGVGDVTAIADVDGKEVKVNKYDLLCPRPGCGSLVIKAGVGRFVRRGGIKMDPPNLPPSTNLSPLPPLNGEDWDWWLITPSVMLFENIGFSKGVVLDEGPRLKLIACGECDLGPIGWSEEGGNEFWLACGRVGYR